jgi:hypothetical protein
MSLCTHIIGFNPKVTIVSHPDTIRLLTVMPEKQYPHLLISSGIFLESLRLASEILFDDFP